MFIAQYHHSIDAKNRMAVPAKFRAELKVGAVVTRGLDSCLFLLTKKDWQELVGKIEQLPLGKSEARAFSRIMLSGAMEVKLDSLGRILLPDYLKDYAGLEKKAVIAGVNNRLEIWDQKKWEIYNQKMEKSVNSLAEVVGEMI